MNRRMFVPAALAGVLLALWGCEKKAAPAKAPASAPAAKSPIKLGFIVKQPEEPWFQLEWKFADEAAKQYGFELVKIGAPDGEKVLSAIDNLAAGGAKGFVICTPDVRLGPAIVAGASRHGMKLISVDDQFVGADGKFMTNVHYLGISARKIGQSVGQALLDEMKARGWGAQDAAVCAVTFEELDTAKDRTEGAIEAMKGGGFAADRIYKAPQKTSDVPGAFDAVNTLLTQHPEVKKWLICGMNDSAVMGAVRAMEGAKKSASDVIGIGINGTDCIVEFEKPTPTGFFASVLLTARVHGFSTAEMLYKWVKDGTEPPLDTRTTGVLINRGNYKQIRKEQGITS